MEGIGTKRQCCIRLLALDVRLARAFGQCLH